MLRSVVILTVILCSGPLAFTAGTDTDIEERLRLLEATVAEERNDEGARRGARLFARSCSACHGRNGAGDGPAARELDPPARDLSSRRYRFRTTPSGALPRPEDLERTIRRGLPGTSMPGFDRLFAGEEIGDLVSFIYSLQPEGIEYPAPIEVPALAEPTAESLQDGRALYLSLGCWRCHGVAGDGRGPQARTLTDETERPTRSTDFRHDPFKGGRDPEAVVRALLTGLNGSPMPAYGEAMLIASGDPADIDSIADRLGAAERQNVQRFLAAAPARPDIERMDDAGRLELRDQRLAALAHYVLSLDRRHRAGSRLFRQNPEREGRKE